MSKPALTALVTIAPLLGTLLGGCSQSTPNGTSGAESNSIVVQVVDRAGLDNQLAELRGKVVLVDCWAPWCLPCIEQLPHTGELANRYSPDDFVAVTLAIEDPELLPEIREKLKSVASPRVVHLVSKFGSSQESAEEFEIAGGALPHYKLYDRQGNLHRAFGLDPTAQRQYTPQDIDAGVAELVSN